jgi:signal peptidase I
MESTLYEGDFLFINRAVYGAKVPFTSLRTPAFREPRRGEMVVLEGVEEPILTIVKRVIGLAGDTLELRNGMLYRNGAHVPEPYAQYIDPTVEMDLLQRDRTKRWQLPHLVNGTATDYMPALRRWGPIVVPPEHLFAMGDNRDASYDGRHWGFLPRKNLLGHPVFIYFSYDPQHWRPLPFFTAIRWVRIFSSPE